MQRQAEFRRMLLGLPHSARDYVSVAFTAELADLLGLDLIGVFAEDDALIDLALLPCVREFRLASDGWHRLDVEQLARSASQAAADARRLFADAAKSLRIVRRFDLVKGRMDMAVASQTKPDDIIVIIEPKSPADRVSHQFKQFVDMALNAPAAALLIPSRIVRRSGPVVVIAANESDQSIPVGLRLAEATREKLLILAPNLADEALSARSSAMSSVQVDRQSLPATGVGPIELAARLATAGERLLVMSPGADHELPSRIASERGIPVLVIARRDPLSRSGE